MKSICISEPTKVGCKKTTYEVEDCVFEYVVKVLEGDEPVPSVSYADEITCSDSVSDHTE